MNDYINNLLDKYRVVEYCGKHDTHYVIEEKYFGCLWKNLWKNRTFNSELEAKQSLYNHIFNDSNCGSMDLFTNPERFVRF